MVGLYCITPCLTDDRQGGRFPQRDRQLAAVVLGRDHDAAGRRRLGAALELGGGVRMCGSADGSVTGRLARWHRYLCAPPCFSFSERPLRVGVLSPPPVVSV
jgi:hypothetical protein